MVYNIPCSLEIAPQDHRLWFWQAARYGTIGGQLCNVTFCHGIDPWVNITHRPYPAGRCTKSLFYYDAGEGIMIYPRPGGGLPFASLRLKLMKKVLDDYSYLSLYQASMAHKNTAENG